MTVGIRRTGRERALQALYLLEQNAALSPAEALEAAWSASDDEGPKEAEAHDFGLALVEGVQAHRAEIDELLQAHSQNWRVDRMQRVDRNVLRLGIYELKWRPDIPRKVSINEAVELGKTFSNEASSAFINGLLDTIAATLHKE